MVAPVNFYADFQGLGALKTAAGKDDPKVVREVARQFEGVFTQMLLKSMRQANLGDGMFDSEQTKFYQDMFDSQMSMQLSRGKGLGLADLLVKQLTEAGLKSGGPASTAVSATKANAQSNTQNIVGAHNPIPMNEVDSSKVKVLPITQPITGPITKGGAEGGHKDVQGVTPSTPNLLPQQKQHVPQKTTSVLHGISAGQTSLIEQPLVIAKIAHGPRANLRQSISQTPEDFIATMWPHAQKAAAELGVDPKTLIAHAALETGWGKHVPCNPDGSCSYNLFGIKAGRSWKGDSLGVNTLEYENGIAVQRRENFRAYASAEDSFRDYAAFLKNSPRYVNAIGTGADTAKFAGALQQGGYATDPLYANKLASAAHGVTARVNSALKISAVQPLPSSSGVSSDSANTRQTQT